MFDLLTYFVYLSLLFSVLFLTFKAAKINATTSNEIDLTQFPKLSTYHILALFIIAIIVGFRYGVGIDWQGYKEIFEDISANRPTYNMEPGYFIINKIVALIGGSSEMMFFIVALMSWYFIFKSVPAILLPLTIYFLFVDEIFFWSMNGVRQFIALSIFLYSIQFIINQNLIKYLLFTVLAMMFHTSAVILLPLYFIPYHKLYNQKFWFIAFIVSFFFANTPFFVDGLQLIITQISLQIVILSTYLRFFESGQYMAEELVVGLGFVFKFVINLFILLFSKEVVNRNPKTKIYFVLFFTSTIIFNLFYMYQPITRMNMYFIVMRCVVMALVIYHLWTVRKYKAIAMSVILLYLLLFMTTIYNSSNLCSPYNFSL